jgi:light-regulated signal transduction histidine kinase (bacteriophytochrome)
MTRPEDLDRPDLEACADEPIHIPGSIQPHGVLIAASEPDLVVRVVSANCVELLGLEPDELLGRPLERLGFAVRLPGDLAPPGSSPDPAENFQVSTTLRVGGSDVVVEAVIHRADGLLVIEVEHEAGPLPTARSYQLTRAALGRIQRAEGLESLYRVSVEEVRRLTGFDRVMVYRFDEDWNGEVVAEDKADDLNSFLGLHYPASDIPAQARELYRTNWLRLIADVDYRPVPLVPPLNPLTGRPLDLGHASLRSVSPTHLEYLRNMGVTASLSVSLLDKGELWGLLAAHHYSGPHRPGHEIRAALEFIGQTLSMRMVETEQQESVRQVAVAGSTVAVLHAAALDERRPVATSLTSGPVTMLDVVPAGGAVAFIEGFEGSVGNVPPPDAVRQLLAAAETEATTSGRDVLALSQVPTVLPGLASVQDTACGALVLRMPDHQYVAWFRPELVRTVSWGGDPRNVEIASVEGDEVRISPRKSFDKWQEEVRGRSEPWTSTDLDVADSLREALLQTLYARSRRVASTAAMLQRSLLPEALPEVAGWTMAADYQPLEGGDVGGDWYDVLLLPSGKIVAVLGDVAGHGVSAAGSMGQLRNGLRAYLVDDESPGQLLHRLDRLTDRLFPEVFATATVVVIDAATGRIQMAAAGHPPVCVVPRGGEPRLAPVVPNPPLGLILDQAPPSETELVLGPGDQLVLYSDGLVERRGESMEVGLDRLTHLAAGVPDPAQLCARLVADCRDPAGEDDATVLVLRRDP